MTDSTVRHWMNVLGEMSGRRVEWPQLLRSILAHEFRQMREHGVPYKGEVFQDRDGYAKLHANHASPHREDLTVYRFYDAIHSAKGGLLTIDDEEVWVVSAQVPNQGSRTRCCADLVGLRKDGALVVFECKVEGNRNDSPLKALLECLDYTGHLMLRSNIDKFNEGLNRWSEKREVPDGFGGVCLNAESKPVVLVTAPQQYFDLHRSDSQEREQQWWLLSERLWPDSAEPFRLDFVVTDYSSRPCGLLSIAGAEDG